MSYQVQIMRRAQKELARLPLETYSRLCDTILKFGDKPRPRGCIKLTGRDGWRLRVGAYRVVYEIDDEQQLVTILHVGHGHSPYK